GVVPLWGVVPRIVSCGLFAVIQLGAGVVPSLRRLPEEDFWDDVKIEKINQRPPSIKNLDISRTQKEKEYVNKD
ncbi:2894_t:CDS:2, partial [Gigaspora rosea]